MNSSTHVRVDLAQRSYDITIGRGLLARTGEALRALGHATHAVVITDEHLQETHAWNAALGLTEANVEVDLLVVPAGEQSKAVAVADSLWQEMLAAGADRKSWVVAVGGGVVGDLAGFVAATFARGLRFLQIPTTLLAAVDSSVGGKVGVNLPQSKNMVGAFWQPAGVLIDTDTLATLPEREYRSGLAEVVKYGVILDEEFFALLERQVAEIQARDLSALEQIIARSCRLKADVVQADEREETGLRAVLNYGHTFGHAYEAVAGYGQLTHGEAVAIGMQCAARLACRLKRVDEAFVARQEQLLRSLGLPVDPPAIDEEALLAAMQHDKKVEHGRLRFVLPDRMGHVELVAGIPAADVRAALRA